MGSGMSARTTITMMESNSDEEVKVEDTNAVDIKEDVDEDTDLSPLPFDISFDAKERMADEAVDMSNVDIAMDDHNGIATDADGINLSVDFDTWVMHMQRMLVAKDHEIHFLRQELDKANQQLHILRPPPPRKLDIEVPPATKESKDRVGAYTKTPGADAALTTDAATPRVRNPRRSSFRKKEERQRIDHEIILDPYGDKGTYTGMILVSTRMPHGTGRMVYEGDERVYDGQWCCGRWHGFGRADFANGDWYEGDYNMDQREGYGKYSWQDGRAYDGQFSEDRRNGEGVFVWPDGSIYEGEFVNGQREGQGTYRYSDRNRYSGGWKAGKFDGYGALSRHDGSCHCGNWSLGQQHGNGIETSEDGSVRHDGQWADGEPILFHEEKGPSKRPSTKRPSEIRSTRTSTRRRFSVLSKGKFAAV